jgi:creatinine amidohydrolase/Fe(II)-dependent formamide hydrolase-like protein
VKAATTELERAMVHLGFKGAMINDHLGQFLASM